MNKMQKYLKIFLVSTLIIATTAMTFKGVTQIVMATKIGKPESIATTYLSSSNLNLKGNTEKNYKLVDIGKPTSSDITYEKAAEIGAKNLNSVFGLDMSDKVIEMMYYPEEYGKRAKWGGVVWINGKRSEALVKPVESYSFSIYSSSGELCQLDHSRVLGEKFEIEFNKDLEQNSEEYENLAKELSTKLGIVQGTIKTAEYYNQGGSLYEGPKVYIKVVGENSAILTFSCYDKKLIGVSYDTYVKEMDTFNNQK